MRIASAENIQLVFCDEEEFKARSSLLEKIRVEFNYDMVHLLVSHSSWDIPKNESVHLRFLILTQLVNRD